MPTMDEFNPKPKVCSFCSLVCEIPDLDDRSEDPTGAADGAVVARDAVVARGADLSTCIDVAAGDVASQCQTGQCAY